RGAEAGGAVARARRLLAATGARGRSRGVHRGAARRAPGRSRRVRSRAGAPGRLARGRARPRMRAVHPARHLLRAKDLADARYREPLDVRALARAAHLSSAHFSREFRRAFGEPPHKYLLTRRMERAAALLRNTDRTVADICVAVGLRSVGSFTTTFGRMYGSTPTAYRAAHPPAAARVSVPTCVLQAYARRPYTSTFGEDNCVRRG